MSFDGKVDVLEYLARFETLSVQPEVNKKLSWTERRFAGRLIRFTL
jgi:hypothetical protein